MVRQAITGPTPGSFHKQRKAIFMIYPTKKDHEKFCLECSHIVNRRAVVCTRCGCPQSSFEPVKAPADSVRTIELKRSPLNQYIAAALAFTLGGLGIHQLYLRRPGPFLLDLLFFWTFIPAFVALVEGLVFMCMSPRWFDEVYND